MCAFDISVVCGSGVAVSLALAGNEVFDGGVSASSLTSKRRKTSNIDTDNSDMQFVGTMINEHFTFSPLSIYACMQMFRLF